MYYAEVFKQLGKDKVRYLTIGGVALVLHGVVRLTGDLDLMVDLEKENVHKFLKALRAIGYKPKVPVKADDFADEKTRQKWIKEKNMKVFSFIHTKDDFKLIDVFPKNPISFVEAYARRQTMETNGIKFEVISFEDLITLKKMSARPQDEKDIEMLIELKKRKDEKK